LADSPALPGDGSGKGEQEEGQDQFHAASLRERRPPGKPRRARGPPEPCIALI
jgi:hypothetical protein